MMLSQHEVDLLSSSTRYHNTEQDLSRLQRLLDDKVVITTIYFGNGRVLTVRLHTNIRAI